jgi:tetratricopeptide (TPR) repeat protein
MRFTQALVVAALPLVGLASGCGGGAATNEEPESAQAQPFESSSGGQTTPTEETTTAEAPEAQPQQAAPVDPDAPPPEAAPPPDSPSMTRARELFVEGMRAYEANDFGHAVTLLTQVDAIVPSAELAYNIAYCYQRMADPEHAVQFYRRYLETGQPTDAERADVDARIARMEQLQARQRDNTMTLPPTMDAVTADAAALFASGQEMFRRRRYAPALQAFSAAAAAFQALDVEVPELVYNLAVTSEHLHSLDDAADYYDEYLRQRPRDPEAERIRAHVVQLRQRRR